MATPVELERLIVKLMLDNEQYARVINATMGMTTNFQKAIDQNTKKIERSTKEMMAGSAEAASKVVTPMERYRTILRGVDVLLKKGKISQDAYNAILEKEYNKLPHVIEGQKRLAQARKDALRAAERQAAREKQISDMMTDATIKRLQTNLKEAEKKVQIEDRAARHLEKIRSKHFENERKDADRAARQLERIRSRHFTQQEKELEKAEKFRQKQYEKAQRAADKLAEEEIKATKKSAAERIAATEKFARRSAEVMRTAGYAMSLAVTAPIVAFGKKSVSSFADFDDAITGSVAVMENVTPRMQKRMEELALQISTKSKTSATDLGESYYFLASAGLDAEQSLASLAKVEKFAVAGRFQMQKATELLLDSQTALGLRSNDTAKNIENLTRVSDVLVKADTIANASVEQFARSLTTKAGNALRLLNKDVEEGVAILSAYAAQGVKAELAGERLYIVLRDLERSARTNSKEFEYFGIHVYDANGKMRKVSDVLRDMEHAFAGMSDQERAATFAMLGFQDRSVAAIKGLIGMSDQIDYFHESLKSASGFTEQVATRQLESFRSKLLMTQNQITKVAIEIGGRMLSSIQRFLKWVEDLIKAWDRMSDAQKTNTIHWAMVVASIGPVLLIASKAITTILALRNALVALNISANLAKVGMTGTGLAMIGMAGIVTFCLGKLAVLAAGLGRVYDEAKKVREELAGKLETQAREEGRWIQAVLANEDKLAAKSTLEATLRAKEQEIKGFSATLAAAKETIKQEENISLYAQAAGAVYGNALQVQAQEQYDNISKKYEAAKGFAENLRDAISMIENENKRSPMKFGLGEGEGLDEALPDFKDIQKREREMERIDRKLQIQAATLGLTSQEVEVYKLALAGASDEEVRVAAESAAVIKAFEKEEKALKEVEEAAEKARHPFEKFRIEEAKLMELFDEGRISLAAFEYRLREIRGDLAKDLNVKFKVSGMEAVEAGSLEAMGKLEAFRLAHILPKAELERVSHARGIGDEFRGEAVKGFARKSGEPTGTAVLEDLLKDIRDELRNSRARPGKPTRPVTVAGAALLGDE